ncbi:ty3-gypsy retroelement transposase [Cucumis melo var. makuwa]|uniref:Ty3-gypsy retroelement transposase n=1 Tax=Cucumis melo var. makuwa TaxID=1194695 RepID=A0A5A7UCK4_CUCMM|nr:ty3-gypsy retroelement transposase [Cucumis melo var. makuwa]TYK19104.1 ty3-gypsy retroelement transposase [Cucumis melo var. makuwa]
MAAVISFDGSTLNWDGTLVGRFLAIKQETTVEEYCNRFDKLVAPVPFLHKEVLEETFMNGLSPWLKAKVECLEPIGLTQMMKLALKIDNREVIRREAGLKSVYGGKYQITLPNDKSNLASFSLEEKWDYVSDVKKSIMHGHRYKVKEQKELRLLMVHENGEELEIIEEEYYEGETEVKTMEVVIEENLNIKLSIIYVVGLTNPGTMMVKGKETSKYGVILGSGTTIKGKRICGKVELPVGYWRIVDNFLPLELGGAMEGSLTVEEMYDEVVPIINEFILPLLNKYDDVFNWLEELPPKRGIEHIHLKKGTNPINVRPYPYAYQQKEEMERLVDEMLTFGIIRPSNNPYSSLVLLVRKKEWELEVLCGL